MPPSCLWEQRLANRFFAKHKVKPRFPFVIEPIRHGQISTRLAVTHHKQQNPG